MSATVDAVQYTRGKLKVLNQIVIPEKFEYEDVFTTKDTFNSIRDMKVRGAPAIALVMQLGLVSDLYTSFYDKNEFPKSGAEAVEYVHKQFEVLKEARPTASNLFNSIDTLKRFLSSQPKEEGKGKEVLDALVVECEKIIKEGEEECYNMSEIGAEYLRKKFNGKKLRVLTHCNAGALATVKYGTSVGVMKFLWKKDLLERAYCTETRPYNQGARLTSFEFAFEKIPVTLLCDSVVSYLLKNENIDCVAVGADRIVANGDTANKIGTYQIAISCKEHGIPFYVVAPITTLYHQYPTGEDIIIEQRPPDNIINLGGVKKQVGDGVDILNPAFDVTPARLISGIITDKGVIEKNENGVFDVKAFLGLK